jgi:hypothetical protein
MKNDKDEREGRQDSVAKDANTLIAGGLGIGAFGLISAAIGGAVCPVCVVAAPALVGVGAYKRWRARREGARSPSRPCEGSGR